VARENRPTQQPFWCVVCGHTTHADVNAAENLARRLNDRELAACADRKAIKTLLDRQHQESPTPWLKPGACPQRRGGVRASGRGDSSEPVWPPPSRPGGILLRFPPVGSGPPHSRPGYWPGCALVAVSDVPSAHRQSTTRAERGASPPCLKAGAPAPQRRWTGGEARCVN
jgi:hypothetical protein